MEVLNNRLSAALLQPIIQTRCAELTVLFTRCSIKDLQAFYPILLDQIFGTRYTKTSWNLHNIMSNSCDFQILQHFFSPMGPLFQLIYTLVKDPSLEYKFNLVDVPNLKLVDFYQDMIYARSETGNRSIVLLLNPFDYYVFSFAQHLLDGHNNYRECGDKLKLNSLYYILCCDYVLHFLPANYNTVVLPDAVYNGKSNQMKVYPAAQRSLSNNFNLFKQSTRSDTLECAAYNFHPKRDIWRSETVLHVFIDFWMYTRPTGQCDFMTNSGFTELPSLEQIRIVRILVKQIHSFASVADVDQSNLAELRKICRSLLLEKIYTFLRHLIHRWPLDGSFRLVLELWLSYIQPWRYCSIMQNNFLPCFDNQLDSITTENKICNDTYIPFIAKNILHYVVIFEQLLPRFLRVDLSSPKNALMLYRLMKVFNQNNLAQYIKHIEMHMDQENNYSMHSVQKFTNLPPLPLTFCWSNNSADGMDQNSYANYSVPNASTYESSHKDSLPNVGHKYPTIARQNIYKLEGVHFRYKSLFTRAPADAVHDLLKYIKMSEKISIEILQARQIYYDKHCYGLLSFLQSLFSVLDSSTDESTLEERRKVPLHLQCAFQYLMDMFEIHDYNLDSPAVQSQDTLFPHTSHSTSDDNLTQGSISEVMTPEKVKQRAMSISYDGNPDLYPIGSNENTLVVRIMYQVTLLLNKLYGEYIISLYKKPNYIGKLSRRFISAPGIVVSFNTTKKGRRQRINTQLPPRISFRKLGNNKILFCLIFAYICLHYTGHNKLIYIVYITFIILLFSFHAVSAFIEK